MSAEQRQASLRRFALTAAFAFAVLAALPGLVIALSAPAGSVYLGHVTNVDDHMVYAAWMRQALEGRFLFDNRFAIEPQPGLTIHLYFLVLGLVAKVLGIGLTANLARVAFSALFVYLLYRIVRRIDCSVYCAKLAIILPLIGGGIGFTVWHLFGQEIVKDAPSFLKSLMLGRLPVDVWQPEVFVFPSMLTNGLFMVSLCLIALVFLSVLEARESRKAVVWGAVSMLALMNIHSYDALLVALVLVGFLVAMLVRKQATAKWVGRAVLIGVGAVPAALWFLYVLKNDPVFQARAATETFSPNFRSMLFGLFLPIVLGLLGLWLRGAGTPERFPRTLGGVGLLMALLVGMFVAAERHAQGYFMSMPVWIGVFLIALVAVALLSDDDPVLSLFTSWAIVGLVAIYFPALFQRKLAMGLAIPWCVLAAYGVAELLKNQERSARNLVMALCAILFGASSVRWAFRELELARGNVSNTTVHPVYLSGDMRQILDFLNKQAGRKVVLAMPGIPSPAFMQQLQERVNARDLTPLVPDLNPIASGHAGVYTYAGHWSETPDYNRRRGETTRLFIGQMTPEERVAFLEKVGADFVISPAPESIPGLPVFDFTQLGYKAVVSGSQFRLIDLRAGRIPESSPPRP